MSLLYEIYDYKHAAAILKNEFPTEFKEICGALRNFYLTVEDVKEAGGNESKIPKKFSELLRPYGWDEKQLTAKLVIDEEQQIDFGTHKVDYYKNRVAFDLEWNSKDQTYDRDLYAFRAFYEYNKISLGILLTRGSDLADWFGTLGNYINKYNKKMDYKNKYGASTTHMGKLLPRLNAGRNGGCPVLVFGITQNVIV
ncbi:MAG TPA: BglII/BstYI family type II restriction endonuclease [Flavisolibacter sp.]|nr:BglII/BstYI family type II restriction endonuclease [Flavisolibacter sp.]